MATRKPAGLSPAQVDVLRAQLDQGRKPRVKLSGTQFGTGTSGTIVRIGDESADGPDFVRVKVKVNGTMDELAFAPSELMSSVPGATAAPATTPELNATPPGVKRGTAKTTSPKPAAKPRSVKPNAQTISRRRKSGPVPTVSISISSKGAEWSVTSTRGARQVSKNAAIPPGVVTAIAKLLGQTAIVEAVGEVNDTARAEAEERAAALRVELNALEAVLATHRAPR
jgi:hypothetical protein